MTQPTTAVTMHLKKLADDEFSLNVAAPNAAHDPAGFGWRGDAGHPDTLGYATGYKSGYAHWAKMGPRL